MKNVKLKVGTDNTIQINDLIVATADVSGRSVEDVTAMIYQDKLHPSPIPFVIVDLQRAYWRRGCWFDDALKHLMVSNLTSKLTIVPDE